MAEISLRRKTRSASICAPGSSSMEQMLEGMPPSGARDRDKSDREKDSGSGTPDSSTPTRRRRPATRSQSARVSGANKSIRRRAAAQAAQHHHHHHEGTVKSAHCSSEPKLTDNDISPGLRRRGSRRGQSMHHSHHRKSNAFLDVPDTSSQMPSREDGEDEDSYRLRSFSLTSKGVINRGDSFRRRRSRSNSLAPADPENEEKLAAPAKEVVSYAVAMLGARGVGKTALISQFMTSECINAYDRQRDVPSEQSVFVMLNGEESELRFLNITNPKTELENIHPDAFIVMYSVIDKASFQRAEEYLERLHDQDLLRGKSAILVGNKVDLVRSRVVSSQDGKCMACTYRVKFIEISVGINHNVDDLLVGILHQIRLKNVQGSAENRTANGGTEGGGHWYKSRGMVRASMKARQMLTWLFGAKSRGCQINETLCCELG
ncbi:GTP-binding protein RAD [Hylaeus anthracinus]|uniref:GTP-binding protein RAD n=1 Tax=Hylaeus anthracinus TaxID=313031 RepID=UPI0023B94294|nr:GTP-binding protein RAD [Hylaeus anthracinus]XP_054012279.1 GTP-binding protein RAD [Hylaeus anthracinus]XP_054012280.1 GTP-binding protein RAD [Hylaeus anthracinus]XP_054012281.1 GTP-binding protein RAD [Hylaeus anthracinus]